MSNKLKKKQIRKVLHATFLNDINPSQIKIDEMPCKNILIYCIECVTVLATQQLRV